MTHHHTAQGLASLGRHGDTMLVHMSPHEVAGLNYLAKKQGTKLTINPETGLPEAFSLGGFFSSLLPTFVGMAFPGGGMLPLLAGAATGAGLAAAKGENPLMGGVMGGLGGFSGSSLGKAFGSVADMGAPTLQGTLPNIGGAGASEALGTNVLQQTPVYQGGLRMVAPSTLPEINAQNIINTSGAGAGSSFTGASAFNPAQEFSKVGDNLSKSFSGMGDVLSQKPGAWDAFKAAGGSGMKLAMPVGGAVLGGLEPTDLYGEPLKPKEDKYDPYATLNLSNDTGLRLLAGGGSITSNTPVGAGLSGLYSNQDMQPTANISQDGYGIGRLDSLAAEGSKAKAADMFYAGGGPVSFADGGDAQKLSDEVAPEQFTGIASLTPSVTPEQSSMASQAAMAQAVAPDTGSSIIEQVTTKLQQDPNYQPTNPIEAAIVKQIKGDGQEGQSQGIAGLGAGPSQPMAPSYTASQPIGPTYYAGMNAPRGFAEGGETSMNLDRLPTLNLNTAGGPSGRELIGYNIARILQGKRAPKSYALNLESGKQEPQYAQGGYLNGDGDGMSDSIPATIEGKQPARLADGEFVVPADVVSHIGNGSSKAGSQRLYSMLDRVRKARTGTKKQGKQIKPEKYMPA